MTLRVRIAARAASQIRKASEWWLINRPAAPNAIAADFGEAVALLAEQPGIGAPYGGASPRCTPPFPQSGRLFHLLQGRG